jgi:hypothetical protein
MKIVAAGCRLDYQFESPKNSTSALEGNVSDEAATISGDDAVSLLLRWLDTVELDGINKRKD